ncbi:hypothetical protein CORC01_04161 [Colletotrichum orchidophilum]|uniref:Uncharacterized protein n=1 Tax=Colletotrichum orchidophilum TaxID=1209926 RepID=A0A1G4BGA5_9PEZI|nr:uncharacterized protein CORC01_04161 [Colletotrichum orchidophilum]OHF00411.1 hypothetical protein CORC01_04161 [Colletotrichum orchidophilum]
MAFTSQYRMPGTYFDAQPAGVHPGVFRPPASPSAGSSYCFARANSYHSEANGPLAQAKRKRRNDASREATPLNEWNDGNMNLDSSSELPRHETPLPIRGARYTLAGQLETPGAGINTAFENGTLDESMYSDGDYRRALGSKRPHEEMESPIPGQPTILVQPSHPVAGGWSRFAFNTIGGVVGKVWEFCKAGAFIGFSAGGGKAYTIDGQSLPPSAPTAAITAATVPVFVPQLEPSEKIDEKNEWRHQQSPPDLDTSIGDTTSPGVFPPPTLTSYAQEPHQTLNPQPELEVTPSRPAVKRRQTSAGNHDELRNWVVVDESAPGNRPVSRASMRPASRNMRPSMVTGRRISVPKPRLSSIPIHNRRQSTTSHDCNSHETAPLSYQEPASFASVRSPEPPRTLTGPSPSRIPLPLQSAGSSPNPFAKTTVSARRQSAIPSPAQSLMSPPVRSHRRSNSSASAASPRGKLKEFGVDSIRASPRLDVEAKKLAARRIKDEHDTDARINDFNQRLKEMIRQGREALGTKVEVDDDGCGWEDD